ncbi:protein of unknown function [Streptomyces murinus]
MAHGGLRRGAGRDGEERGVRGTTDRALGTTYRARPAARLGACGGTRRNARKRDRS